MAGCGLTGAVRLQKPAAFQVAFSWRHCVKTKLCWFAVALLLIWVMKRYYSGASAAELWWILSPTARLTGGMAGTWFSVEPGAGYPSGDRLLFIEKSCAGSTFLTARFV